MATLRERPTKCITCKHIPATADKLVFILSYLIKTLKSLGELPEENHLRLIYTLKPYTDILLDGTERPIEQSVDEELQKECFSGKKKALFEK